MKPHKFNSTNFWHVILIYLAEIFILSLLLIFAKIDVFSIVWNYLAAVLFVLNFVFLFLGRPRIIIDEKGLKCQKMFGSFFIPANESVTMRVKEIMVRSKVGGMDWIYLIFEYKSGEIIGKTLLTLFWNRTDLKNLPDLLNEYRLPIAVEESFNTYIKGSIWKSTAFKGLK